MSHPPFVADVVIDHRTGDRCRLLIGELLTAVSIEELQRANVEHPRVEKWSKCGVKTVLLIRFKADHSSSEVGCYASLDDIANAIDARVVAS